MLGFSLLHADLSLVAASEGSSLVKCAGFSLQWLLLLQSMSCRVWAQYVWPTGLVAPCSMWNLLDQESNPCPCTGRRILQHWTSRKVPLISRSCSALHLLNSSPLLLQDFSHLFPPPSIPLVPRILSSNLGCHFLQAAFLTPKSYSACHQDPKIASQLSS